MDITLNQQIPEFHLPASMMYCFPTGSLDLWRPKIEQVVLPDEQLAPMEVEVKVKTGVTSGKPYETWKRRTYNTLKDVLHGRQTLDYSGQFVFDARFDTYKNIAHILENVATCVFFAQQVLTTHLQREVKIQVIVDQRIDRTSFAIEAYRLLCIPLIMTDADVRGDVVTVSEHRIFSVKRSLFDFDFPGYDPALGFEKIFIPRRGNRSLVNNDEVTAFLESRGFRTCYYEDYPVHQQWAMTRNAKVIVAVHGAAVSSVNFNRSGLESDAGIKVIELLSPGWIHSGFREAVTSVKGRWAAVRGQLTPQALYAADFSNQTPDSLKSPYKDPVKVDCQTIQLALDYLGV